MLLRSPAASRVLLSSASSKAPSLVRPSFANAASKCRQQSQITRFCTVSLKSARPLASKTARTAPAVGLRSDLFRRQTRSVSEEEMQSHKIRPQPQQVSATSTMPTSQVGRPVEEEDVDMMAGIRSELRTIRNTFDLSEVPREAFVLGAAGLLPYVATASGVIYCSWEMNHAATVGSGMLMSGGMAEALLHILEPLQIGYGAVILSFLGAIHWGLEWAKYGGHVGYRRYMAGVIAPAIAWPTTLLSPPIALITQFLGFTYLYYADASATARGWAPPWYAMYRFVLTFVVGASIVATLVGHGEIAHMVGETPSATDRVRQFRETAEKELSTSEKATRDAQQRRKEHTGV